MGSSPAAAKGTASAAAAAGFRGARRGETTLKGAGAGARGASSGETPAAAAAGAAKSTAAVGGSTKGKWLRVRGAPLRKIHYQSKSRAVGG